MALKAEENKKTSLEALEKARKIANSLKTLIQAKAYNEGHKKVKVNKKSIKKLN